MKNNIIIGIDDDYSSIYIWSSFNGQIIPLYFNSLKNNNTIVNGTIYDKKQYFEIIKKLVDDANKFIDNPIKDISLCLDNFNVNIQNFDYDIKLKNKSLTQQIWEDEIYPNLQVKSKNEDQYIYYFDVIKWQVGEYIFEKIDREYFGDEVKILGKKYIINKLIYDSFKEIFEKLDIKIKNFNTTLDLYKNSDENDELNILINKNNISITSIHNNHLISNVICDNKGINNLIEQIEKDTKIKKRNIIEYISNINFFKENPDMCIANINNNEDCKMLRINQSTIDEIIKKYTSVILDLILEKIEYYKKEKDTTIRRINLISNSIITQHIFNLFNLHKYQFNIVKPKNVLMFETKYTYCILNAQKMLNEGKTIN